MSFQVEMPQLSAEGESATLVSWLAAPGDVVQAGDVIAEFETDKSNIELEAPVSGTLTELIVAAGSEGVTPGTALAVIDASAGGAASADAGPVAVLVTEEENAEEEKPPAAASAMTDNTVSTAAGMSLPATPLARRAAAGSGLDLSRVEGSGPRGRILEADVLEQGQASVPGARSGNLTGSAPSPGGAADVLLGETERSGSGGYSEERLSVMRRTIARRMTESKQSVPHFYLRVRCRMDEVIRNRARLNEDLAAQGRGIKISINDMVVKAAAVAMRDVPAANVSFAGDVMHVFDRVDVCVAVATEGGLVTPVVRDADRKGLVALSQEIGELAERAQAGRLRPEEYQGGTLTISNLGMYGIETVYPILNPPQACILGVGAAEEQPVVRAGQIEVGRIATLTLAADHRAIDGAVGAQWLSAVREHLEDPMGMML